jgi:glycosyl hydrolase family 9/cellulase-like Ig domain-containing protein
MKILINHLGYEQSGFKQAVIQSSEKQVLTECYLMDSKSGEKILTLPILETGPVDKWKNFLYWNVDFSDFSKSGRFYLQINQSNNVIRSDYFTINKNLVYSKTFTDVLAGLKIMRCSGKYDRSDYNTPVYGSLGKKKDVHGGWYDASGDTSKYLSHLSYANYMNPQQTPLVVWGLLKCLDDLENKDPKEADIFRERLSEEAVHGADFLVRMQDDSGFFYMILFDQWNKDIGNRMICSYTGQDGKRTENYQAGFRQGGGMTIAALARVSTLLIDGDFISEQYLKAAEAGFLHLQEHNLDYLNNGEENIIDDYCALIAASELYNASSKDVYLKAAEQRAGNLIKRLSQDANYSNWWRADSHGKIPFFHASDAGMPVISLLRFLDVVPDSGMKNDILETVKKSMKFELSVSSEVNNPFGYARQYVKGINSEYRTSFFIPHDNWSGYWWQGENARIASLSAALSSGKRFFPADTEFIKELYIYSQNQLNWILGLNPFDICMVQGFGRNNPEYEKEWKNYPGGIVNGITSGFKYERDIDFLPSGAADIGDHRWRWSEQWLPHAIWYLMALSI